MPDPVLPDEEALLASFLRGHSLLTPLHGGRVGTDLSGTYPAVRVAALGGPAGVHGTGAPRVQIECWADTREQAGDLARACAAALPDMQGRYAAGVVRGARAEGIPFPQPDETTSRERFILQAVLLVQPL